MQLLSCASSVRLGIFDKMWNVLQCDNIIKIHIDSNLPILQPDNHQQFKDRYTLATKLNSTRSTMLKVDKVVDRIALALYTLETKSTVSAKVDCIGDKVDHIDDNIHRDKLLNSSCCWFVAKTGNKVDRIVHKVDHIGNSWVWCWLVASFGNSQLCRQCAPGSTYLNFLVRCWSAIRHGSQLLISFLLALVPSLNGNICFV